MTKQKLIEEVVYSPVNDHRIKAQLNESPIWKTCYTREELTEEVYKKHGNRMYAYHIKFEGNKPVQHTHTQQVDFKKVK